jgi:apolipoprotein N-acyltransferase
LFSSATWRALGLGALSGAIYFLACPPYGLSPLAWVAIVPLWVAIGRTARRREALAAGIGAGFAATFGIYFWIADTAHRFWDAPWPFALLLLAIFATFAELHFAAFALLARWLRRPLGRAPAAVGATLFTACEMLTPRIFPDKLGHTQVDAGALSFAAGLVGTHGLSFVLAWSGIALARLLPRRLGTWPDASVVPVRHRVAEVALCALAAVGLATWGAGRRADVERSSTEHRLDVAIVQSNIGDPEEIAIQLGSVTAAIDSTIGTYVDLSAALAGDAPDLVVWPETAVPAVPRPRVLEHVFRAVQATGADLVFGGYDSERRADSRWRMYNAAFHMDSTGAVRNRYFKHKLLLFGEYVPLSNRFPQLLEILPSPGEFTPGLGPRVFEIAGVALTPLICYELLFPRVVRAALRGGGTAILNLTNDYWFGRYLEPQQHLALTRMCALEFGRPIVRATNTGLSALVGADGAVLAQTRLWEQTVLRGVLPVPPMRWTPFGRWGEATVALLAGAACALVALAWVILRRPAVATPATPAATGSRAAHAKASRAPNADD